MQDLSEKPTTTFGRLLYHHYVSNGMSQAQLSRAVGVAHGSLSRLVHGSRNPSREMTAKLANALQLERTERAVFFAAAGFLENDVGERYIRIIGEIVSLAHEDGQ